MVASIAELQGVTGDHGRGGRGCDEQSKATEVAGTVWVCGTREQLGGAKTCL